jgi:hypothetical protein
MKPDFYSKSILTIIAICLSIMTLQNLDLVPKAYANNSSEISAAFDTKKYAVVPVNEDGSINVNIKSSSEMDVNISNISTHDELDVNIDEVGGFSTYGEVPVKIK